MGCRRIAVHIGTHKTGSSAIQTSFQSLKPDLAATGWHYLDGGPNHSFLYLLFADAPETEHDMIKRGLGSPMAAARWVAEVRARVEHELCSAPSDNVLISGEELCRLTPAGAQRFIAFLRNFASDISVACFVRSPIGYCLSDAQEGIKGGLTMGEVIAHPPVATYRLQLQKYIDALGRANVHVLQYRSPSSPGPSGFRRLSDAFGLPDAFDETAGRRTVNESLSLEAALILSEINQRYPLYVDGAPNPKRGQLPMRWLRALGSTPFSLPQATLERSRRAAGDDLAWLQTLVGEPWFADEPIPASLARDPDSAALTTDLAVDVAGVLNDAALLVQETMGTLLRDRQVNAQRSGNAELAAKFEANLRLLAHR